MEGTKLTSTEVISVHGFRVQLNEHVSPYMREILSKGGYELREIDLIKRAVTPKDRVIELGSGSGITSMVLAQIVGIDRLRSYDGSPYSVDWARQNGKLNGFDLDVRNEILTTQDQQSFSFSVSDDFWASSLEANATELRHQTISVPARNFDEVCAEFKPNVLVADIEGGEIDLFEGSELHGITKIICEFHYKICGVEATDNAVVALYNKGFRMHLGFSGRQVCFFRRPRN